MSMHPGVLTERTGGTRLRTGFRLLVAVSMTASVFVGVPVITGSLTTPASAAQKACTDLDAKAMSASVCERVIDSSTTWTIPAGVTSVDLIIIGGSGGGGAGPAAPDFGAGGGGGGGEVLLRTNVTVTPGAAVPVTVGLGGYGAGQPGVGWGSTTGQDGTATTLLGFTARPGRGGVGAAAGSAGAGGATDTKAGGVINGLNGGGGASFASVGGAARATCTNGYGGGGGGLGAPGVTVVGGLFPAGSIWNSYPLSPGGSGGSAQADPTTCTGQRERQQYAGAGAGLAGGTPAENAQIGAGGGGGGGASGYLTGQSHVRHAGGKGSPGSVIIRFLLPPPTWVLSYDAIGTNGGVAPGLPVTYTDGDEVTVDENSGNYMKIGYVFDGWNTEADGTGTAYQPGDTFEITGDLTLYAAWAVAPPTYTVGYGFAGATGGTAPADPDSPYDAGDRVTVLGNTGGLTRTGYSFDGWSTQPEGKGTHYEPGDTFIISADTVMFPVWTADGGSGVPSEVRSVEVVGGSKEATVSWTAPADEGDAPVTNVVVTADPGSGRCVAVTPKNQCTVTGLRNGTTYTFTVTARNARGLSDPVTSYSVTPGTERPPGPPRAIVGAPKDSAVDLRFRTPLDRGTSPITEYRIVSRPGGRSCDTTVTAMRCTVKGLTNGTSYRFEVQARNSVGWGVVGLSGPAVPGTRASKPRDLKVTSKAKGSVSISWQVPASDGGLPIRGYVVFYRLEGGTKLVTLPTVTSLERTITGLRPGARYRISVAAVNRAGRGLTAFLSRVYVPRS